MGAWCEPKGTNPRATWKPPRNSRPAIFRDYEPLVSLNKALLQGGPLPVISGVTTPISRVITPFKASRGPPCRALFLGGKRGIGGVPLDCHDVSLLVGTHLRFIHCTSASCSWISLGSDLESFPTLRWEVNLPSVKKERVPIVCSKPSGTSAIFNSFKLQFPSLELLWLGDNCYLEFLQFCLLVYTTRPAVDCRVPRWSCCWSLCSWAWSIQGMGDVYSERKPDSESDLHVNKWW